MYLKSAAVQNIKGLAEVDLKFDDRHLPGWHVVLGDNSAGARSLPAPARPDTAASKQQRLL